MFYRFEEFLFDPKDGLKKRGQPISLEPRASDLLSFLLQNSGRLITRDELCDHIWDGKIVSEAAISTQIRAVRKALGDDRSTQKFIKTHPRRGVRFVADVELIGDDVAIKGESKQPKFNVTNRLFFNPVSWIRNYRTTSVLVTVLACFVIGLLAIGSFQGRSPKDRKPDRNLSIVVLPFDNLSGDPSKAYLADAFSEDLITDLSRIRDAFVISRSTSFTYREKNEDAASVASDLGVRYALEGSVNLNDERARINVRLIDGSTSSLLWSNRYEVEMNNLFNVQHNVTGRIASVLRAELRKADIKRQVPEIEQDAWDYALRGNVLLYNHQSVTDYQEAYALLSKAVSMDETISSAWSGLAFVHFIASFAPIPDLTRPDSAQLSLDAALKATEVDPMNAEPYWLVGAGYARTDQAERGMTACQTAMDLNPNMDCGHVCAGLVHMAMDEPEKAIPYFKHALELNPRFRPFTKEKYLGLAYIQSKQDELAIAALHRALAKAKSDSFANLALISALALSGEERSAQEALDRYKVLSGSNLPTLVNLRKNISWFGPETERMLFGLQKAGLAEN